MNARRTVKVRCVEPCRHVANDLCAGDRVGCGWTGSTIAITEHGTTTYQIEECPDCRGAIEPQKGGDHEGRDGLTAD
jgi:hypothetical protein